MSRIRDKSKLLKLLAETPVVSFACKKIGLDRTTYYRWYKDDKDFREKVDYIMTIGRTNINDMAEASIIKEINNGNMRANIFWLQHNHSAYRPVRTTYVEPMQHYHDLKPGEICRACGYAEPKLSEIPDDSYMDSEKISKEIYSQLRLSRKKGFSEEKIKKILDKIIQRNKPEDDIQVKWIIQRDDKKDDEEKDGS